MSLLDPSAFTVSWSCSVTAPAKVASCELSIVRAVVLLVPSIKLALALFVTYRMPVSFSTNELVPLWYTYKSPTWSPLSVLAPAINLPESVVTFISDIFIQDLLLLLVV